MNRPLFLLATFGLALNATASDLFTLKPTLLHPDTGPAFVPAARISSAFKKEWDLGRPDRFANFEYALASTLSLQPETNDEKTSLDLRSGIRWDLDDVPPPTQVFPGSGGAPLRPSAPSNSGLQWGSIATQFAAAFEGNEPMTTKQWTYGLRLNYSPAFDRPAAQWWFPYIWLDYRRVTEISTELTAKIGTPAQNYWRFGSELYWQIPLSLLTGNDGFGKTVKFVPGLQYYRSTNQQLTGDQNDAYYYSAALDYTVPENHPLGKKLSAVRIQVSHGRVPPVLVSRTTIAIVLTVQWDKLLK